MEISGTIIGSVFLLVFAYMASMVKGQDPNIVPNLSEIRGPYVMCFFPRQGRTGNEAGSFNYNDILADTCTHYLYAYYDVTPDNGIAPYEAQDADQLANLVTAADAIDAHVLLSIGGWDEGSEDFSAMAVTNDTRKIFIDSVIQTIKDFGLSGVDILWQYPTFRDGSKPGDKEAYTLLLKELLLAFENDAKASGSTTRYTLTITVAVGWFAKAYDQKAMSKYADLINLLTLDFFGSWDNILGIHTALYNRSSDTRPMLNQATMVQTYLDYGVPAHKLLLGVAAYGRSFRLYAKRLSRVGDIHTGVAPQMHYTNEHGLWAYHEICPLLETDSWLEVFHPEHKSSYAFNETLWVGYDSSRSMPEKGKYVKEHGLAGVMFWDLSMDDYADKCGQGKSPLLTSLTATLRYDAPVPTQQSIPNPRIVCFLPSWARYRDEGGKFTYTDIAPNMCTHYLYAFYDVTAEGIAAPYDESDATYLGEVVNHIKEVSPDSKVLLSIGGWNEGSEHFSKMAATPEGRETFIASVISVISSLKLDGVDILWQYPTFFYGGEEDRDRHTDLLKETMLRFIQEAVWMGTPRYTLCATVATGWFSSAYNIPEIGKYVDFLNVLTFDFYGSWEPVMGIHSALYSREGQLFPTYNQAFGTRSYTFFGVPAHKINMGVATYGRTFTLISAELHEPGDEYASVGPPGEYTKEPGFLGYNEICHKVNNGNWETVYHQEQKGNYAFNEFFWIGYDGPEAMIEKAKFIRSEGLGGAMVWDISMDDFTGNCGQGPSPLLTSLTDALIYGNFLDSSTPTPQEEVYKRVCYFAGWAKYRAGDFAYTVFDIDPDLCTHVIFAFYELQEDNTIQAFDPSEETDLINLAIRMQESKPYMKVEIGIGGWSHSEHFPSMAATPQTRQTFIESCIETARRLNVHGIDIDWEFPANDEQKETFTILLQESRAAFEAEAVTSGQPRLLISAGMSINHTLYDVIPVSSAVDFMCLMTYDMYGPWEPVLGLHSALYSRTGDPKPQLNQDYAVTSYLDRGAPAEKLILGLPAYGRSFTLNSPTENVPGEPYNGAGEAGVVSATEGVLFYYEICQKVVNEGWIEVYDAEQVAAYAFSDTQWVGYESPQSLLTKVDYIKERGLGGVLFWEISQDDFNNLCGNGPSPLLSTVADNLK